MFSRVIKSAWYTLLATTLVAASTPSGFARDKGTHCTEDAMLVFDGSGSMAAMGYNGLDQPRIVDARQALRRTLPQITPFRRIGLIVYGPGTKDACNNIDLRLPPTPNAANKIIREIDGLSPAGETPLTRSVQSAADALDYRNKSGTIVLVTDGKETCGGATCRLAAELAAETSNMTVHVIGFKVRGAFFNWQGTDVPGYENGRTVARCLADRTGGKYVAAETTDELVQALRETLACPMVGMVE